MDKWFQSGLPVGEKVHSYKQFVLLFLNPISRDFWTSETLEIRGFYTSLS